MTIHGHPICRVPKRSGATTAGSGRADLPGAPVRRGEIVQALLGSLLLLSPFPASAAVLEVPEDYPTIQAAIEAAIPGDLIRVGPGTYPEQLDYLGKDISVVSELGPEHTIIDGLGTLSPLVQFVNGESRAALLKGFTLTEAGGDGQGGAIFVLSSAPTIEGNIIAFNEACVGAGIRARAAANPLIVGNVISDNRNICTGPGASGAAVSGFGARIELRENRIERNITGSSSQGAAVFLNIGLDSVISRNYFAGNEAVDGFGGALGFINSNAPTVEQNLFVDNRATFYGGALYWGSPVEITLSNNTIADNTALSGSALYLGGSLATGAGALYNNVFSGYDGTPLIRCFGNGPYIPRMFNNQLDPKDGGLIDGTCTEHPDSTDNVVGDPMLSRAYSPQAASPLVDAGREDPPGVGSVDFLGQPRVVDGNADGQLQIDVGAIERRHPNHCAFSEACWIFADGFESGDATVWSSAVP